MWVIQPRTRIDNPSFIVWAFPRKEYCGSTVSDMHTSSKKTCLCSLKEVHKLLWGSKEPRTWGSYDDHGKKRRKKMRNFTSAFQLNTMHRWKSRSLLAKSLAFSKCLNSETTSRLILERSLRRIYAYKNLIGTFTFGVDKYMVVLLAVKTSRIENQDVIDATIVNMLTDPKEAIASVWEIHFLPSNPTYKRTALSYIDKKVH